MQAAHSSAHIGGVRVIAGNNLDPKAAQTPGMDRKAAINFARVGAEKLWAGTVTIHPDAKTGAHHHGHLERVIHVVKGAQRREAVAINLDIEPLEKPEAVHWVDPIHLAPD